MSHSSFVIWFGNSFIHGGLVILLDAPPVEIVLVVPSISVLVMVVTIVLIVTRIVRLSAWVLLLWLLLLTQVRGRPTLPHICPRSSSAFPAGNLDVASINRRVSS